VDACDAGSTGSGVVKSSRGQEPARENSS
jgi:hypothetical protein